MNVLLFALPGYLLGSVSFAVIVSRAFGLADPRSFGSGNPGATNVLRTGNKLAALLTLLGDALKGWLAMALARLLHADLDIVVATGVAAFLGHLFPLFLRFRGGKGVATALGVLAGFSGWLALACAGIWLLVALLTRYSSLAALVAAAASPFVCWWLARPEPELYAVSLMAALLVLRHRANIRKLIAGTEGRIGSRK